MYTTPKKNLDEHSNNEKITMKMSVIFAHCFILSIVLKWILSVIYHKIRNDSADIDAVFKTHNLAIGKHFILDYLLNMEPITAGLLAGISSLVFCWTLTYFNWLDIGSFPATPLSPNASPYGKERVRFPKPAILSPLGFASLTPLLIGVMTGFLVWKEVYINS